MFEFHTETNTHAILVDSHSETCCRSDNEQRMRFRCQRPLAKRYDMIRECLCVCLQKATLFAVRLIHPRRCVWFHLLHNFNFAYMSFEPSLSATLYAILSSLPNDELIRKIWKSARAVLLVVNSRQQYFGQRNCSISHLYEKRKTRKSFGNCGRSRYWASGMMKVQTK